jgi:hypothetical protein
MGTIWLAFDLHAHAAPGILDVRVYAVDLSDHTRGVVQLAGGVER